MLFNPKWERFSAEALMAWLETRPPEEAYDLGAVRDCLIGQYLQSISWPEDKIAIKSFDLGSSNTAFRRIAGIDKDGATSTFGAALERARSFITDK